MEPRSTIRISAVGDIALNGRYNQIVNAGNLRALATSVAPLLAGSDIAVGNLEGPLTTRPSVGPAWCFTLRGHPAYAPILRDAGLNVLSLANNHMMDHGWEGLEDTCTHLRAAGIRYFGAGRSLREAREPLRITVRGLRIAFLAYCNVSVLSPIYADVDRPGVAPARRSYILADIAAAQRENNVVIVCMHWGQEHVRYPAPKHRRLAFEMIAAGANLIIGHHPHVLQGVERVAKGAVSYSLGNFVFSEEDWQGTNRKGEHFSMPYRLSESARRAAVWRVVMDGQGPVLDEHLVPTYLGPDLLPALDRRPECQTEIARNRKALSRRGYRLLWTIQMTRSRIRAILDQFRGNESIGRRLLHLRPRHLREMLQVLIREWEQLRGVE